MRPFDDRRILLVVSGGIAAYKSVYLLRRLQEAGARIEVVLTESATRFVGPATFEGLTGSPVRRSLWEEPLAHIHLGRDADAAVVAPATADLLARMAIGRADDLATTTLLAADCPLVLCPAMNTRMWEHPATRANVERLRDRGSAIVDPAEGELAEGEIGVGRMAEPEVILARLGRTLEDASPLSGRSVVVTAGPTRAFLDPVRFLSNASSGRMGYALAASAWRRGAEVTLISGPASEDPPHGARVVRVVSSGEMLDALESELPGADALLMAAAVTDFESTDPRKRKIGKREGAIELSLRPGPDLLASTRELREAEGIFSLGFALETDAGEEKAREKLEAKGLDAIALNMVGEDESGIGMAKNRVTLLGRSGEREEMPLMSKEDVADRLLDSIEQRVGD